MRLSQLRRQYRDLETEIRRAEIIRASLEELIPHELTDDPLRRMMVEERSGIDQLLPRQRAALSDLARQIAGADREAINRDRMDRRAAMQAARDRGEPVREIGLAFGITRARVYQLTRRPAE